jgi:hypothetical protein
MLGPHCPSSARGPGARAAGGKVPSHLRRPELVHIALLANALPLLPQGAERGLVIVVAGESLRTMLSEIGEEPEHFVTFALAWPAVP